MIFTHTGASVVAIESLPTRAFSTVGLAELHGVVRSSMHLAGFRVYTAPQSTARKLILGALPPKDRKKITIETIRSFNECSDWGEDECDAFVAANWLCAELGMPFLAAPQKQKAKKARKRG